MKGYSIKKICVSAFFLALCLTLPFFTLQIKGIGKMLLPMHLPVYLCGMILGPIYGLIVGIIAPIIRSVSFGMPRFFPDSLYMAIELATYGFVSGILYKNKSKNFLFHIYKVLIVAMIAGRITLCFAELVLLGISNNSFILSAFITKSVLSGIPGIIIQLIFIPIIMILYNKGTSNKYAYLK